MFNKNEKKKQEGIVWDRAEDGYIYNNKYIISLYLQSLRKWFAIDHPSMVKIFDDGNDLNRVEEWRTRVKIIINQHRIT